MNQLDALDAFLNSDSQANSGQPQGPSSNNLDALDEFLGTPLSPTYSLKDITDAAKSFGTGLKTGVQRGFHGYVQPLLEGDKGASQELVDRVGYASPIYGNAAQLLKDFVPADAANLFDANTKQDSIGMAQRRNAEYQQAYENSPTAAGIGDFTGNVAAQVPAMFLGSGKVTGLKAAAQFAAQNMLGASGNYVEGNDAWERAKNMGFAGLLGAMVPGASRAADFAGGALDDFFTKGAGAAYDNVMNRIVAPKVFAGVDAATAIPVKEAGERLGVHLSPAEASGSKLAYAEQGRAGNTHQGALDMQNYQAARIQQERNALNTMRNEIAPPKGSADYVAADPLYDKVESFIIPQKKFDTLTSDELVNRSYQNVLKNPEFSNLRKDLQPNSMKLLDLTKQDMDFYINAAKRDKNKTAYGELIKSKENLVSKLDKMSDDYGPARAAAQRQIIGRGIDAKLDDPTVGASMFYRNELKKNSKFNQIVADTKDVPGMTQKLNDMRIVFKDLINPRTGSGTAALSQSSLDVPRSSMQWLMSKVDEITGGLHDRAVVNLIKNPQWDKELLRIRKMPDVNQRRVAFVNLLSKAGSSEYSSPESQ